MPAHKNIVSFAELLMCLVGGHSRVALAGLRLGLVCQLGTGREYTASK